MERIGVRELRQYASRYLDRVKLGETVEVTERGRLVALLVPPSPATNARERLVSSGRLIPATRVFRLPKRVPSRDDAPTTDSVLDDLRQDRV
jgi:prevent-host-death family protein